MDLSTIVNYHVTVRKLSLMTTRVFSQHCVSKKRRRKKVQIPRAGMEHARRVCEPVPPRQRGKKEIFKSPFNNAVKRGSKIRITHKLHTRATWRDLMYTALTFYTATRRETSLYHANRGEANFLFLLPFSHILIPGAICKLKMALQRGREARRIFATRISG